MAKPGRKQKPAAMKVVAGTDQNCRTPDEPTTSDYDEVPDPPDYVIGEAREIWYEIGDDLRVRGVLKERYLKSLAHLVNVEAKCRQLYRAGEIPKTAMITELRRWYGEFGLTAAAEAGSPGATAPKNKFSNNGHRARP